MNIDWKKIQGIPVAVISGRLDSKTSLDFGGQIETRRGEGDKALILDMEQVSFISSAGLSSLLRIASDCGKNGQTLKVCSLQKNVQEIMRMSGFVHVVDIVDDQIAALRAIG